MQVKGTPFHLTVEKCEMLFHLTLQPVFNNTPFNYIIIFHKSYLQGHSKIATVSGATER